MLTKLIYSGNKWGFRVHPLVLRQHLHLARDLTPLDTSRFLGRIPLNDKTFKIFQRSSNPELNAFPIGRLESELQNYE